MSRTEPTPTSPDDQLPEGESPDTNIQLMSSPARYVQDHFGEATLERIANMAGIDYEKFSLSNYWTSWERFRIFLDEVHTLVGDDETFKKACAYKIAEAVGPLRFLHQATSPTLNLKLICRISHFFFTFGKLSVTRSAPGQLTIRYVSSKPDSRAMCLSRQANFEATPALWGHRPAVFRETSCIAFGDDCCTYEVVTFDEKNWRFTALGGIVGLLSAAVLAYLNIGGFAVWPLGIITGAIAGYFLQLKTRTRQLLNAAEELKMALQELAADEREARHELFAIEERRNDWSRQVDELSRDRNRKQTEILKSFSAQHESHRHAVRGFSHDLRSPLAIIRMSTDYLLRQTDRDSADDRNIVQDIQLASTRMDQLIKDLLDINESAGNTIRFVPSEISIDEFADSLQKRLRALTRDRNLTMRLRRDVHTPQSVTFDPQVLDRIADNLLTNAFKYTDHGVISVELSGSNGYLEMKFTDTGVGIPHGNLRNIFLPLDSNKRVQTPFGYGIGLSIVLQLVALVGGRLEIASDEGQGTCITVYLPQAPSVRTKEGEDGRSVALRTDYPAMIAEIVVVKSAPAG